MWSLQLLNAREVHGEVVYNAHDIVVTTPNAIMEFIKELNVQVNLSVNLGKNFYMLWQIQI